MSTCYQILRVLMITAPLTVAIWALTSTVYAVEISTTYVGTYSNPLSNFGSDPNNNPGQFARGGKYVVRANYDTADLLSAPNTANRPLPATTHVVQLIDAPGTGGNTYELFIPSQGFNEILTQNGQDHFFAAFPDITKAPTAEIQFFNAAGTLFRGFEFESNFIRNNSPLTPLADDIIFEQFTSDANFSGTTVTNYEVNILDGGPVDGFGPYTGIELNGGHVDVLSQSTSGSGGQLAPGVFFAEAMPIIANAGLNLVYDAATLSVTTNAGTEQITETVGTIVPGTLRTSPSAIDNPTRQADNDLGAARTDKEDFLTFDWTLDVGGLNTPASGNMDGTRLNRIVETLSVGSPSTQQHGSRFSLDGLRTVENVNIAVPIENSGLQNAIDTTTIRADVIEAMTGFSDDDTLTVSYNNVNPTLSSASGMTLPDNSIDFNAVFDDLDLIVNPLIPGFESVTLEFLYMGSPFLTGPSNIDLASLLSTFGGLGTYSVDARATDLAGAKATLAFNITIVPEPAALALVIIGTIASGALVRPRRHV
jgi:hypothetical protein